MQCFNPRPREGATHVGEYAGDEGDVSIHAPVKGRPGGDGGQPETGKVSIHAPVKGRPAGL